MGKKWTEGAIRLRTFSGWTIVEIEVPGKGWVEVIRDTGLIHHIVEVAGINLAIENAI